jgi:murein DD-endopeptidase MepM/ murein hydrolase activator NlpD
MRRRVAANFAARRRAVGAALLVALCALVLAGRPARALAAGTWRWPVVGPVVRGFDPPDSPYGSGHRGIDIAAPYGTLVRSPAAGTVRFAGRIGDARFVSIDHGGGIRSTYSWVSATLVRRGDLVGEGMPIAATGEGHPGGSVRHLHLGVVRDGAYVDPMNMLAPPDVSAFIRLAPLPPAAA